MFCIIIIVIIIIIIIVIIIIIIIIETLPRKPATFKRRVRKVLTEVS